MPKKAPNQIFAAGAVLWRPDGDSEPLIAVVHRPRYHDWSLPKGKVDAGETQPVTAVREVEEETGFVCELGRRLASVSYPVGDRTKRVVYWSARTLGGEFTANSEVDELEWLPVKQAMKRLQYPYDRKILRRFAKIPADTRTVLIVRHGTAGRKSRYRGDDRKRPLDKRGRAQAESLVGQLLAFGATTVHSAPRVRCQQTVGPLAEELGVEIAEEPTLTEEAFADDKRAARHRVLDITKASANHEDTPVICTQGKVIPDLIAWWCDRDGAPGGCRCAEGSWGPPTTSAARSRRVSTADTRTRRGSGRIHGASCTGTDSGAVVVSDGPSWRAPSWPGPSWPEPWSRPSWLPAPSWPEPSSPERPSSPRPSWPVRPSSPRPSSPVRPSAPVRRA